MKTVQPSRLLKLALYADAAGTAALGALQLAAPSQLGEQLSLPLALLTESGIFMAGYAALLVYLANARRVWAALVRCIAIGNVGWAAACLALAWGAFVAPSGAGSAYLAFQAAAVLVFAGFQLAGLRNSAAGAASTSLQFH